MKKYFIVGTNDNALHDTMNGNVIGELIRCKDCKHYQWSDNRAFGYPVKRCEWTGFEDIDGMDYCSRAERKEK